ncbi:unnamed protein product [Thlaspi arvense]|uniref:USP domain-containing protein n=1 Tax=Thlaspi arvense TaxID=13288 RepID=A0AAU9S1T3_THLAR|nr:unnamed protein product [Thlaspi arvense]
MVEKVFGGRLACQLNCCYAISEISKWNYLGKRIHGLGSGLRNDRQASYLNSTLQCLTHTELLMDLLNSYHCENPTFCALRALRNHIHEALTTSQDSISPDEFLDHVNRISTRFLPYQQEDAYEFLMALLDNLECCCPLYQIRHIALKEINIVQHVFGGVLISLLRCCNCSSVSETFENSLGLSLVIEDVDNISSALELFTRVETFEEKFSCDDCKKTVSKEKKFFLDKLPRVATLHLKRFAINQGKMQKICKAVTVPFELDLKRFMRDQHRQVDATNYYLYAFVEHVGTSVEFGHYISYVRSSPKAWHKFDDAEVSRIDEDSVQTENSYILFYAREDTLEDSSMATLHLEIDRGTNGDEPDHVLKVQNQDSSPKPRDLLLSAAECSLKPRLDIDRGTNGDEPDHVLKVQNQDSSPKPQDLLLSAAECSLKPRLDIDRGTIGDDLFDVPSDLFDVHAAQERITKLFEKLKTHKLDDDKQEWDAKRQLQKAEMKKKRDAENKRREELKNQKGKGNKKNGEVGKK